MAASQLSCKPDAVSNVNPSCVHDECWAALLSASKARYTAPQQQAGGHTLSSTGLSLFLALEASASFSNLMWNQTCAQRGPHPSVRPKGMPQNSFRPGRRRPCWQAQNRCHHLHHSEGIILHACCGKKQNKLSSVLLLLTPAQGRTAAVQPAKTKRFCTKKAMSQEKAWLIRTAGRPGGLHDALQALCSLFHC